jgi:hypothetical protein
VLLTDVPDELAGRGIEHAQKTHAFAISLDRAEPWGGGQIAGRVEARAAAQDGRPVAVAARCIASWLDVAPQLVGQKRLLRLSTYWDLRTRGVPIWLDDTIWLEWNELGTLDDANWLPFVIELPPDLPRALEGSFVSFRWRIEARRSRRVGHEAASNPLLLLEERTLPVIRVETSPLGSWRLLEWRAEEERDGAGGPCSVRFEERRPEDMPLPGETRAQELARRGLR